MDCSACLSCGMVVLLIIAGCRLFHSLMVLGKKDDLYTSAYQRSNSVKAHSRLHWPFYPAAELLSYY